jgi:protein-tyrosine phosphatase
MAAAVMTRKLAEAALDGDVVVSSSGTGTWHLGEAMDRRAASTLAAHGYDPSQHRAELFGSDGFVGHDLVLAMDAQNFRDIVAVAHDDEDRDRALMFRAFDPLADGDLEVPDPFYGAQGGFDEVLAIIERTCDALVAALAARQRTP